MNAMDTATPTKKLYSCNAPTVGLKMMVCRYECDWSSPPFYWVRTPKIDVQGSATKAISYGKRHKRIHFTLSGCEGVHLCRIVFQLCSLLSKACQQGQVCMIVLCPCGTHETLKKRSLKTKISCEVLRRKPFPSKSEIVTTVCRILVFG